MTQPHAHLGVKARHLATLALALSAVVLPLNRPALADEASQARKEAVTEETEALKEERQGLKEGRDQFLEALKTASATDKSKIETAVVANAKLLAAVENRLEALKKGAAPVSSSESAAPAKPATTAEEVKETGQKGALAVGEGGAVAGEKALEKTSDAVGSLAEHLPGQQNILREAQDEMAEGAQELKESKAEMHEARKELGGDVPLSNPTLSEVEKARVEYDKALESVPADAKD